MSEKLNPRFERDPDHSEELDPEKPRVIIADDEAGPRLLLRSTLDPVAKVEEYTTGEEVLKRLADETRPVPDIVMLDNNMGAGLTGLETAKRITEYFTTKEKMAPDILLVTAAYDRITPAQLKDHGVREIITKPYSPLPVIQRVQQIHQARKVIPVQ